MVGYIVSSTIHNCYLGFILWFDTEFNCQICRKVMILPVTTPCAHNFCKACLEAKFSGITQVRERSRGGRTLRTKKNIMTCPCCTTDLSDFLQNPQVKQNHLFFVHSSCYQHCWNSQCNNIKCIDKTGEQRSHGGD